ncbi:S8 family serine peptidase [Streptomonospora wellingtoniae]|uniref:S8 family serine peptidase n=1 Tax=Streptomonospora wellingtoniae TaxID=3075544 RepID=A0ABU2KY23_9ACTN|nr:S8 family serine peptidase [Streptomonospora sp. DSM 45055]MDT0304204.1 S8 family serine peptidase [Streptomonospora sp. DSM 45055]
MLGVAGVSVIGRKRAAARMAGAAACAVALLVPQAPPAAAAAAADSGGGGELRPEQWGMDAVGAAEAADRNDGGGVLVALLGGGVDASHPDLGDGFTEGDAFAAGSGSAGGATPLAGIIAGRGHGREYTGGVVGVAPGADLLSVRVADGGEAAPDALNEGIRYAVDEGAQVLLLSAGAASAEPDEAVAAALGYANRSGALVVAPAGKGGSAYPGAYEGATAVGAVGEDLALTADSPASGVDLVAPGTGIRAPEAGGGYTTVGGTAAAAAFVAGAAVLVRAEHPQLRPAEVADALTAGTREGAAGAQAPGYGAGVLDAPAAMERAASSAEGQPLFDESLADQPREEAPGPPVWALWTAGVLLAVLAGLVVVLLFRRAGANPYDLPSRRSGRERGRGGAEGRENREERDDREPAGAEARSGGRRAPAGRRRGGRRRR